MKREKCRDGGREGVNKGKEAEVRWNTSCLNNIKSKAVKYESEQQDRYICRYNYSINTWLIGLLSSFITLSFLLLLPPSLAHLLCSPFQYTWLSKLFLDLLCAGQLVGHWRTATGLGLLNHQPSTPLLKLGIDRQDRRSIYYAHTCMYALIIWSYWHACTYIYIRT